MKRIKQSAKNLHTEEGATLVELLAAIAILSIVVMSFLAFFVQAGNTNNRTDKVNEATLLAQAEMENVMKFNQISNQTLDNYKDLGNKTTSDNYKIDTNIVEQLVNEDGPLMYKIIVTIQTKGGADLAQMEMWVPFKDTDQE